MAVDVSLLQKVKDRIRRSHNLLDEELADTISECLRDLERLGIVAPEPDDPQETDPLILGAVKLYCQWATTDDPAKAARYLQGYEALKASLMMDSDYKGAQADG